jgi:magnesium-transporting ATPase (P-type)
LRVLALAYKELS